MQLLAHFGTLKTVLSKYSEFFDEHFCLLSFINMKVYLDFYHE